MILAIRMVHREHRMKGDQVRTAGKCAVERIAGGSCAVNSESPALRVGLGFGRAERSSDSELDPCAAGATELSERCVFVPVGLASVWVTSI